MQCGGSTHRTSARPIGSVIPRRQAQRLNDRFMASSVSSMFAVDRQQSLAVAQIRGSDDCNAEGGYFRGAGSEHPTSSLLIAVVPCAFRACIDIDLHRVSSVTVNTSPLVSPVEEAGPQ